MDNFAVMGIYTVDGGGAVFSANTTGWVRALNDPAVSRVTSNLTSTTTDSRLRFWFQGVASSGDVYWIDDVRLEEIPSTIGLTLWNWVLSLLR
jgi:hypothetical protein